MKIKGLSFKQKLIILASGPILVVTLIAIIVAGFQLKETGEKGLIDKSTAILSRMESVRNFVGENNYLDQEIAAMLLKYPDGDIPQTEKEKLKAQVPIIASWMIGEDNAHAENYEFKIAAFNARNPKNEATPTELEFIERFRKDKEKTIIYTDKQDNKLWVMRPVFLKQQQSCLVCHGDPKTSPWQNGRDILGYPMENWKHGDLHGMFIIKSDLTPVQQKVRSAIWNISIWGIGFAILGFVVSWIYFSEIVRVLNNIVTITRKISAGDLSHKLKVERTDEFGVLSDQINKMMSSLSRILSHVSELSDSLDRITDEVANASQSIATGAQEQAAQFEELNSAVESTSIQSTEANQLSQHSAKEARVVEQSMLDLIRLIAGLEDSSGEIAKAIQLIADIAIQTNLLALNAGVEAARAGEHGRGFAIVAAEVKKLAEKSRLSAKEIQEVVTANKLQTQLSVQLSRDANLKIKSVIENIQNMASQLSQIQVASQEQTTTMERNTQVTIANASAAEQLANSSQILNQKTDELNAIISGFKF